MSFYVPLARERRLFLGLFLSAPVHVSRVFRLILLRVGCMRPKKKKKKKKEAEEERKKEKKPPREYVTVFF